VRCDVDEHSDRARRRRRDGRQGGHRAHRIPVDDPCREEFDGSIFEEISSTHYGRMVHLDDRTLLFANPEDAAEYIGFDLTVK
jgi:hypothetical protein